MKFSRLLATGRSLIGMRDTHSPYRMRTENLLPKFESAKNPFAGLAKAEQPVAKVEPVAAVAVEPTIAIATATANPFAAVPTGAMELSFSFDAPQQPVAVPVVVKEAQVAPVTATIEAKPICPAGPAVVVASAKAPVTEPVMRPTPPPAPKLKLSAWMQKVNPLAYLPAREADKPVKARAVQTELSLERVKVMRNDLNDTDLEVIPARTAGKPETAGPRLQPLAKEDGTALSRMTSRFFGAGQPQV